MKINLRILNLVAYIAMIYANYVIGFTQEGTQVLFTPAGYTFSIWLLIYVSLFAFVIYQLTPRQKYNPMIEDIGLLFVLTSMLNIMWLLAWNRGLYLVSWLIMLMYFILLGMIYLSLNRGCDVSRGDRWFIQIPFSIYFAWISVAFIANTAVVLDPYFNSLWIAIIGIIIATVLTLLMTTQNHDLIYLIVVVWAIIGIFVRHYGTNEILSLVAALAVLVLLIQGIYIGRSRVKC